MTRRSEGRSDAWMWAGIAVLAAVVIFGISSPLFAADSTVAGIVSARATGATTILVRMPYTGDDNSNNSITVQYKLCTPEGDYTSGITELHANSPYITSMTVPEEDTCYDIKTTYNDTDGVSGAVIQTLRITLPWDNTLIHNSNRFPGTAKHGGNWGLPGTKYGRIDCRTCHTPRAGNIKGISGNILSPNGTDSFPGQTGGQGIVFQSTSEPDGFGDDASGHATSQKVCEVCHTYDATQANGVKFHACDMSADGAVLTHQNRTNCMACHSHGNGFRASCDDCHGNPPGSLVSNPGTTGSTTAGAHSMHVNTKGIGCEVCHYGSAGGGPTHNDGPPQVITLGFSLFGGIYSGGSYDGQSSALYDSSQPDTTVSNNGPKTCSNIYCHGATMSPNGGTDITPVWDNPSTGACGTCHGATAATPPARGSHFKHTAEYFDSLNWGYMFNCGLCHKDPGVDASLHVNNRSEIVFSGTDPRTVGGTYTGTDTMLDSYGTCNNVYCHSTAQSSPPGGPPTYRETPSWGTTYSMGMDCDSCHYYYDSTPQLATGSHAKHFQYGWWGLGPGSECAPCHNYYQADESYSCAGCHTDGPFVPATANHVNRAVDVRFGPVYGGPGLRGSYSGTPAPNDAYGQCSNIYCHSNGTGGTSNTGETRGIADNNTTDWGSGPITCSACHGSPPGYSNGVPKANSHTQHGCISCDKCHYPTTTDGNSINSYSKHVNRKYDIGNSSATLTYSYNAAGGSCSGTFGCHGNAQWGNATTVDSSDCLACHKTAKGSRRQIVDSNGNGTGTGGDFKKTSHHVLTQITSFGSGVVTTPSGPTATAAGTGGFTSPENAYSSDGSSATCTVNGNTQYYNNYGTTLLGNTQTITKVEVGITGFYTATAARTSWLYLQVSWDGGTSWSAEQYVVLPRNTASTAYKNFTSSTTWNAVKLNNLNFKVRVRNYFTSTPATTNNLDWVPVRVTYDYITTVSNPLGSAACVVCHEMSQHLCGSVRLKDADTGTIYTYDPANPSTAENFCLGCHDTNGANGNMSPFSDGASIGNAPYVASRDIKTNWQKTYGHKQKGLTCLGDGTPNTGCHSNGHGSDYVGLLSKNMTLPQPSGAWYSASDEGSYEMCFNCHQNYPRVTKEAILGYRVGGNYDINGDGPPPYGILDIPTKFRDQNYDKATGKVYDDWYYMTGFSNLHYFHVQTGPGAWAYRGSIDSSVNCISCHNVHGSNTQWGWVYDEIQYTHLPGIGSDQYGKIGASNLDSLSNYPTNCTYNCHSIMNGYSGTTSNWFEPSGE